MNCWRQSQSGRKSGAHAKEDQSARLVTEEDVAHAVCSSDRRSKKKKRRSESNATPRTPTIMDAKYTVTRVFEFYMPLLDVYMVHVPTTNITQTN